MITDYQQSRFGNLVTVTVTSGLTGSPIYYHWYIDGCYVASTTSPVREFFLADDEQVEIAVNDTLDANYDPIADPPTGWPARKTLWWVRSLDTTTAYYRVEQQKDAGAWTTLALLRHDEDEWTYTVMTGRLDDLASYAWRVVPVDEAGNDGTNLTLSAETIVRRPDCPDYAISFDSGTAKVTFSAAA